MLDLERSGAAPSGRRKRKNQSRLLEVVIYLTVKLPSSPPPRMTQAMSYSSIRWRPRCVGDGMTQDEAAVYIAEMASELRRIAARADLLSVAYFLEMVVGEARSSHLQAVGKAPDQCSVGSKWDTPVPPSWTTIQMGSSLSLPAWGHRRRNLPRPGR